MVGVDYVPNLRVGGQNFPVPKPGSLHLFLKMDRRWGPGVRMFRITHFNNMAHYGYRHFLQGFNAPYIVTVVTVIRVKEGTIRILEGGGTCIFFEINIFVGENGGNI